MNDPASPSSSMVTFVVRIWHEASGGEPRWRGQIEHAQSGEKAAFLELESMLGFLRRYGVEARDTEGPARDKG
jgi:hypothetical protein